MTRERLRLLVHREATVRALRQKVVAAALARAARESLRGGR
jgi:hypothetical protein